MTKLTAEELKELTKLIETMRNDECSLADNSDYVSYSHEHDAIADKAWDWYIKLHHMMDEAEKEEAEQKARERAELMRKD